MEGPFETLGFAPAYEVERDPEFPGDGNWNCRVFGFDHRGQAKEPFESRWGALVVVGIDPINAPRWVGTFTGGGRDGVFVSGLYACPSPNDLCVVADGNAYLVDVTQPDRGAPLVHDDVSQVLRVPGKSLVLLVRFIDIVAIGVSGVAWRTPRLVLDFLRVEQITEDKIVCSGREASPGSPEPTVELDPDTGKQVAGERFDSMWPRDDR
jgi:hypothetical protein